VRLQEFYAARRPRSFRPDALRHYSAAPASVIRHQAWVDGLVLLSTGLFALLVAYFVLDVLPAGGSPATLLAALGRVPDAVTRFLTPPAVLPAEPVGASQQAKGVVTQVADARLSATEAGREAGAGAQFLVVTAIIDNQGNQPIAYDLSDWTVVDAGGRTYDPERFRGAGWLSAGRVDPGQRVQGVLAFAVAQGEASHQVRFGPAGLRAVMRWDAPTPAGD
jgi:hypothetical protein